VDRPRAERDKAVRRGHGAIPNGRGRRVHDRHWRLALTKRNKRWSIIRIPPAGEQPGTLRSISSSENYDFSNILVSQVGNALWREPCDSAEQTQLMQAALAAMTGMKPRDELEGMLIGQLIATHNAAMECYRRAMLGEQTFEGRRENLNQANKLCRSYAALTEALDRHRGKGQQRIVVEHVNVHAGGQAIVGAVTAGGESSQKSEQQTHATREITHEPGIPMRSPDPEWETMPIAAGARKAAV
jgi:hypothetical protein